MRGEEGIRSERRGGERRGGGEGMPGRRCKEMLREKVRGNIYIYIWRYGDMEIWKYGNMEHRTGILKSYGGSL